MTERPNRWVSIDPGDRHVGFATWIDDECLDAVELTPEECIKTLELLIERKGLECIVYEKFALYGWNEKSLAGNEFITSQLIGVIKYLANRAEVDCVGQFASEHKRVYRMGWFKELSRSELREMPWWGHGGHAKDAWVVGEWFKRQRKLN
jgi:hypothetical protein